MLIRPETSQDVDAITQITSAAFAGKSYSDGTEHLVIQRLREAHALTLSLVAEQDGNVIGHVAFSAVTINGADSGWYGLGPVAVLPALQQQGIGSQLIEAGLSQIRSLGAKGCVLEGSPQYYQRFGFKTYVGLRYAHALAPEYFMALPFDGTVPEGQVEFHPAFYTS